tara:strand:- start:1201 stop:1902 length:702 start_codon:yes stop_codon:yes gene_type:complete
VLFSDVASIQNSVVPLALVAFVPTISVLFTLGYNDDDFTSQIFFFTCKIWLLLAPAYWYLRIEKNSPSWSFPTRDGIVVGGISGIIMSVIIIVTWILFGDTLETSSMISELESTGLTEFRMYLAGMIYWIFVNSLLEEYVFRWFVTTKAIELLGSEARAIFLSAILFTLHHAIALHYFGFVWWQTVMACFGLLSAAAIWSWLYVRYRSVWVCWFSHSVCDVAVFGLGYLIIFG